MFLRDIQAKSGMVGNYVLTFIIIDLCIHVLHLHAGSSLTLMLAWVCAPYTLCYIGTIYVWVDMKTLRQGSFDRHYQELYM